MKAAIASICLVSVLLTACGPTAPEATPSPQPAVDSKTAKTVRDRCGDFIPKYWHNKGKTKTGNLGLSAAYEFTGEVGRYTSRIRDHLHISFRMLESGRLFLCSVSVPDGRMSIGPTSG